LQGTPFARLPILKASARGTKSVLSRTVEEHSADNADRYGRPLSIGEVRKFLLRKGGMRLVLAVRLAELPLRSIVGYGVRRIHRDPSLCVFGATMNRFGDNSAYLYVHLAQQSDLLRCVWITGSRALAEHLRAVGFDAEKRWSRRGIVLCVRAGSYVVSSYVSDVNRWLGAGATLVNLWHGVPLKKIERDIDSGPLRLVYEDRQPMKAAFSDQMRPPDLLLSPSAFVAERCFTSAFAIPLERCLPYGYPRTDHFFSPPLEPPHELLVSDVQRWHHLRRQERVVGYFPTWRDERTETAPGGLDLEQLGSALDAIGAHLVFKPHPHITAPPPVPGITVLSAEDDADAYLPLCDVLVTDYSSLAFDFMLLQRPIVYFVPDIDEYASNRGFYFPPEEMMPGPLIRDPRDLAGAIEAALVSEPDLRLAEVRELVWGDYAGRASERVSEILSSGRPAAQATYGSRTATR
jgi:CDP-glycerol glycerophosphotransferase (TagB/SpsB family)